MPSPVIGMGPPNLTMDCTGILLPTVIGMGTPLLTADGSTENVLPPAMTPLWTADGSTDMVPPSVMGVGLPLLATDDGTDIISPPFIGVENGTGLEEVLGTADSDMA